MPGWTDRVGWKVRLALVIAFALIVAAVGWTSRRPAGASAAQPDIQVNAVGKPFRAGSSYSQVRGLVDGHSHMMAFEFLGGRAHCGRPWSPQGPAVALRDCPDHQPNGAGALLENLISHGSPFGTHDTHGWPTFAGWPDDQSLTHEDTYYKWLERSWRGGLRIITNLFVENGLLCRVYPLKKNSCDEMASVRLQNRDIHAEQAFIDAQSGGPGKGWFRIVTNPYQARRVIAQGKLAVILGIEVSEPFGCRVFNDQPQCDRGDIDRGLNEVYGFGVRQMEIINKFDNALAGVAGDEGSTGVVVNNGNKIETGKYWQMQHCTGPPDESDKQQPGAYNHDDHDLITAGLEAFLPPGAAPIYPNGAQCNRRGLTSLGDHTIRRMMAKHMIVDPDHLSVKARKSVMSILESRRYGGVISSHSWSTPDVVPRIYRLGGMVTPMGGLQSGFINQWRRSRAQRDPRFYFGFGWGDDMNGFAHQAPPRPGPNPVHYPFRTFDGGTLMYPQRSGSRVYNVNRDGMDHYGLYPDWVEDLRHLAGRQIEDDLGRGAEAYLDMWERADGVPGPLCRSPRVRFNRRGLSRVRLGYTPYQLLRRAGQPQRRGPRVWRYCVAGRRNRHAKVVAVLTRHSNRVALVESTARRRYSVRRLLRRLHARHFGRGLLVRRAGHGRRYFYGVRHGHVRFAGVATRSASTSRRRLRAYLRLARLG